MWSGRCLTCRRSSCRATQSMRPAISSGKKDEALKISNELNQPVKRNGFLPKEAAYLYALLGEKEKAVAILQKAAEDHYLPVAEVKMDPRLDELRKDPRVVELLQQIGLPQ